MINNNNNNNQNENQYNNNNKLYNSVFNNIVIRRIIFNHLNKFNILYNKIEFNTIEEWNQFKYKDYLNKVIFRFDIRLIKQQLLLENIKQISIVSPSLFLSNNSIINSSRLDSVRILSSISIEELSNIKSIIPTSNLNTLKLSIIGLNELQPHSIPESITDLELCIQSPAQLLKDVLPSGLKKLKVSYLSSFQHGCLPESLTDVRFLFTTPELLNQLSSNGALVKLFYQCSGSEINSHIQLPNSIQDLSLSCYSFNTKLPDSLKSLSLTIQSKQKERVKLPSTLKHLKVYKNAAIQSLPIGLKSLEGDYSLVNDQGVILKLPNQLETFINYKLTNKPLQCNQLPSNLTYLDLGNPFNQVIDVGLLPSTLKTLVFGFDYSQIINPSAIPHQLKSLIIYNSDYLHPIKLSPSTHPYTLIECHNINLYYQPSNTDIRVLGLPRYFDSSLSSLQLKDKSKLEYLKFSKDFNQPIQLSDLPINNQIKTLEFENEFDQTINLEYFQNLQTIIINDSQPNIITTTTTTTDNNNNNNNNNNNITYNNYKLQNIIVDPSSTSDFIKKLDSNFYQFIKVNK